METLVKNFLSEHWLLQTDSTVFDEEHCVFFAPTRGVRNCLGCHFSGLVRKSGVLIAEGAGGAEGAEGAAGAGRAGGAKGAEGAGRAEEVERVGEAWRAERAEGAGGVQRE